MSEKMAVKTVPDLKTLSGAAPMKNPLQPLTLSLRTSEHGLILETNGKARRFYRVELPLFLTACLPGSFDSRIDACMRFVSSDRLDKHTRPCLAEPGSQPGCITNRIVPNQRYRARGSLAT